SHAESKLVAVLDFLPVHLHDHVTALDAGRGRRSSGSNIANHHAVRVSQVEGLRHSGCDVLGEQSEIAAHYLAMFAHLVHHVASDVDGNGKTNALTPARTAADDRGVDPDQCTARVDQRTARVPGINGRVG